MTRPVLTACLPCIVRVQRSLATLLSFLMLGLFAITGARALALAIVVQAARSGVAMAPIAFPIQLFAAIFGSCSSASQISTSRLFLFRMCSCCISRMIPHIAALDM